ncbi:MAG: DUF5719 family protein, partial [Actinomycetota bacterium]|nr:DUF5719 family protein [Actinomycetota bacterium]
MRVRSGEGAVAVVLAVFVFGGVALDSWGPKVSPDASAETADAAFSARAVFCPPALGKPASRVTLTAAARGDEPVSVGFEPASDERTDLAPASILEHRPPTAGATDVVGYGGAVDATAVTSIEEPVSGVGASGCAPRASSRWYFPEGNSTVTHDERLLIYNPFPDEAVVRVSLLTPAGEVSKAGLADVPVPSESSISVAIEDFILEEKVLGAVVEAVRGRVVAWRLSIARPEEKPSGIQLTLGTTALGGMWYFPEGAVGEGFEERLSIMNPGTEEAIVDVSLVTTSGSIPAAGLTELAVPALSTIAVVLDPSMLTGESGGAGAVVRSVNDVPVAVERTVFYATEDVDGVASEIGARTLSERWLLGPATTRPETDWAVLLNPGSEQVEASIALLRASGPPLRPTALRT